MFIRGTRKTKTNSPWLANISAPRTAVLGLSLQGRTMTQTLEAHPPLETMHSNMSSQQNRTVTDGQGRDHRVPDFPLEWDLEEERRKRFFRRWQWWNKQKASKLTGCLEERGLSCTSSSALSFFLFLKKLSWLLYSLGLFLLTAEDVAVSYKCRSTISHGNLDLRNFGSARSCLQWFHQLLSRTLKVREHCREWPLTRLQVPTVTNILCYSRDSKKKKYHHKGKSLWEISFRMRSQCRRGKSKY